MTAKSGPIYIGVGGWTFAPWRGLFYPPGLSHSKELSFAAARLTSIEVNGTFYRTQTPATFRKWASEVPKGFLFSLKGPRFATNRRVLKEAGDSIKRFLDSGVTELGDRLGPLLWQFAPTKKFDPADFGGFLELLPDRFGGHALRHVIEVRHDSFRTPEFVALLRKFDMPVVYTDHVKYPNIADLTGKFVYARLQRGDDRVEVDAHVSPNTGTRVTNACRLSAVERAANLSQRCRRVGGLQHRPVVLALVDPPHQHVELRAQPDRDAYIEAIDRIANMSVMFVDPARLTTLAGQMRRMLDEATG